MTAREMFRQAYRAARMMPHKHAAAHAFNQYFNAAAGDERASVILGHALKSGISARCGEWRFGIESAKRVMREGRSGRKCIAIWLTAAKHRQGNRAAGSRYFPATKFNLSTIA